MHEVTITRAATRMRVVPFVVGAGSRCLLGAQDVIERVALLASQDMGPVLLGRRRHPRHTGRPEGVRLPRGVEAASGRGGRLRAGYLCKN